MPLFFAPLPTSGTNLRPMLDPKYANQAPVNMMSTNGIMRFILRKGNMLTKLTNADAETLDHPPSGAQD